MPYEPIQSIALLRCIEALIKEHGYKPEETGDLDDEGLVKLIGEIKALGYIPNDVQTIALHEIDGESVAVYVEVRVKLGELLLAADQLDPYDYAAVYTYGSFQDLVANVINDVNERAARTRAALAAYKKEK